MKNRHSKLLPPSQVGIATSVVLDTFQRKYMQVDIYLYLAFCCSMYGPGVHKRQKRALDPLELELQGAINHLVGATN